MCGVRVRACVRVCVESARVSVCGELKKALHLVCKHPQVRAPLVALFPLALAGLFPRAFL